MTQQLPLRIGVLEDQPLFREMLQHLLLALPGAQVVAAADCAQALAEWDPRKLDVVLLDIQLPDGTGLDVGRALQLSNPRIGVVLLSAIDRAGILLELSEKEQETWSYLSKQSSTSASALIRTIRASAAGRRVIDSAVISEREARANGRLAELSARQFEVLGQVAEGLTNQGIADRLGIALNSVSNHINTIYTMLDLDREACNPRVSATRLFLEETS